MTTVGLRHDGARRGAAVGGDGHGRAVQPATGAWAAASAEMLGGPVLSLFTQFWFPVGLLLPRDTVVVPYRFN